MNTRKKLKLLAEIERRNNERIRKMISEVDKNEHTPYPHAAHPYCGNSRKTEENQGVQEAEYTNLSIKKEPGK